jgi:hypothetical protein
VGRVVVVVVVFVEIERLSCKSVYLRICLYFEIFSWV